VRSSEAANLPRFRGQTGFFEIWFAVVFEPSKGRALWVRYTVDTPKAGAAGSPCAILWAAAFDARRAPVAVKRILPIEAFDPGPGGGRFRVRIGDAVMGHGELRGRVEAGGHSVAWDLDFNPAPNETPRLPALLRALPLPTNGAHANAAVRVSGTVVVDGERRELDRAPALQVHLHGTRRVEELHWIHAPELAPSDARVEVMAVRTRRGWPRLTTLALDAGSDSLVLDRLSDLVRTRLDVVAPGVLDARAETATRAVVVRASCDVASMVGYVYRDPSGFDVYVAQSDVGSCVVETFARRARLLPFSPVRRFVTRDSVALEFHELTPLPGIRYVPWEATHA
jgi:hypothetical protein